MEVMKLGKTRPYVWLRGSRMTARTYALWLSLGVLGHFACGLRSDADEEDGGGEGMGEDIGEDSREGSCDTPFVLPFRNFEARGRLKGSSKVSDRCGKDGDAPDAGPEDSYLVTPTFNVDVVVRIPEADFEPTLRVNRDGCREREDVPPIVCAAPMGDRLWRFFAEVGHDYTITVDSPEGTDGRYTMEVLYVDPDVPACPTAPGEGLERCI